MSPIYTNTQELPGPMYRALTDNTYDGGKHGDISATGLIKSPRQRQLEIRHDKEIVVDAIDNLWSVAGTAMHDLMVKHAGPDDIAEKRLTIEVDGIKKWKLTGEVDLIEKIDKDLYRIVDYKWAGIYSYLLEKARGGVKEEWEQQLNIYRYIVHKAMGLDVPLLRIGLFARDHVASKAGKDDYPSSAILLLEVIVWPLEKIGEWIKERIILHQKAEKLPDDKLPDCTAKERWERASCYAVMTPGRKTAHKLCSTTDEAAAFVKDIKGAYMDHRPGQSMRCQKYCKGAPFCNLKRL